MDDSRNICTLTRPTFFWRRQWKMKMNIPCRVLKMVKRYAITMEESSRKNRPKDQVSPSRQRRTNAPDTHDLGKNKAVVNECRGRPLCVCCSIKVKPLNEF